MAKRTILLCGATGFIGRNLLMHLSEQANTKITAVYHKRPAYDAPENVSWVQADLRNPDDVKNLVPGHDQLIQAAATTSGAKDIVNQPYIHVTDNAVMNSYLLRAAYDSHIEQFVFFSCSVMYPSSTAPQSEDDVAADVETKYQGAAWTKMYIERMCQFYAGLGRTKHTVIRHSNVYGPHDKFDLERSHVFGATLSKAMQAEGTLEIWGTGEEKRDLIYVDDLVSFVAAALEHQPTDYGLYNCGAGSALSVKALAQKIVAATGKKIELKHDLARPTIPFSLALDCTKAKRELGWTPDVSLEEGIARTHLWWQQNIDPDTLMPRQK